MVRRTVVVDGAAGADIGLDEVEDIDLVVEEGIGLGVEERHKAAALADKDYGMEEGKIAAAAEDRDCVLGEGLEEGSHAAGVAGRIGLGVGSPVVGRSLEVALVVVERRSLDAAGTLVGDIVLVGVADNHLEADIHLVVGGRT